MIHLPKTIHYVWLGQKPLHPLMQRWQDGWTRLHPGWQVKLWTESSDLPPSMLTCDSQIVECRHPDYLAKCPTYAKRSDVWRYEILEQLGGVYLDTDFEPVKCIEPLLDGVQAFAGLCQTKYDWSDVDLEGKTKTEVGCSIMGSVPHHTWLRELVRLTPTRDPLAQLSLAFPFCTETIAKHPDVTLFEPVVFYPVTWDQRALGGRRSLRRAPPPDGTYAIHQWSSSWFDEGLRLRTTEKSP
jgi:mannosyltransferase OCH1-like enzyme